MRYLKSKMGFRNTQVDIHIDLKLSLQSQIVLVVIQLARIPPENWLGQLGAYQGLSVRDLASQGPVRPSQYHSPAVRTTSGQ